MKTAHLHVLDLLHPNKVTLDVSKKVLYIHVSQEVLKLPAVKTFASLELSILLCTLPDLYAKKF